jgi:hypothetical protein
MSQFLHLCLPGFTADRLLTLREAAVFREFNYSVQKRVDLTRESRPVRQLPFVAANKGAPVIPQKRYE